METKNTLSRRTLLKASSFLAASAAMARTAVAAAKDVPPVQKALLAEYREASVAAIMLNPDLGGRVVA